MYVDYGVATSVTIRTNDNTAVIYFTNGEPIRPMQIMAGCFLRNTYFQSHHRLIEPIIYLMLMDSMIVSIDIQFFFSFFLKYNPNIRNTKKSIAGKIISLECL